MSTNYFYDHISQMEPLLPSPVPAQLEELALELVRKSAALGSVLHPITRLGLVDLLREMNCYYSNLIEGHNTRPLDIQKALKQEFSTEPEKRALQLESIAHIAVQRWIDEQLKENPSFNICSTEFLCSIHREFYNRLPGSFKTVMNASGGQASVIGGSLRHMAVQVGRHIPPDYRALPAFLSRFSEVYAAHHLSPLLKVIAIAASHHRLAWIHPFLDGNGRVIRLFSDAYFTQARLDGHGLWTMARGLARHRADYMQKLMMADSVRQGDLDGRGNLSQKRLIEFCEFFLNTALDQVQFMHSILEPEYLKKRIIRFVHASIDNAQLKSEAIPVLQAALLNGELSRGEAISASGMSERSGRTILKSLLEQELLIASSPKGPVRLGFPLCAVEHYFPNLYVYMPSC